MTIITISRQIGSLGDEVAALTAHTLNYRLVGRELINQAARHAGVPEMALAEIDELGLLNLKPTLQASRDYRLVVEQFVRQLASEGNAVLVGRAGQVILRDNPSSIHIRIVAPLQVRIQRIIERYTIDLECAAAQVKAIDLHRKRYLRVNYHHDLDDPDLYHIIVNTAALDTERASRIIQSALT